jgi:LPXTG-motif cell wall-anchored protein
MKRCVQLFNMLSVAALLAAALSPAARADTWNKKTVLTITEAIQVPNKVLEPGKYVFKLADSQSDRHIVQIFTEDEKHLVTTILAIPNYRLQPTGKSEFGFWETPAGQPRAMRAWFYPGDNFGQEFAYKPSVSVQIARYSKTTVPTTYSESETDLKTAKVEQTKVDETTEVAQQRTPEPAPEPTPEPAPAPVVEPAPQTQLEVPSTVAAVAEPERVQAADAPAELPQTGSSFPLIGLAGLLSLGAFAIMTMAERKRTH